MAAGKARGGRIWGSWWNPTNGTNTHTAIDGYDAMGRPLYQRQQFYNGSNWSGAYNVNRTYDLAGNVLTQTYPSGRTVSYTYDQMGRTTSFAGNLGDSVSRTYMTAIAFDDNGRMIREQFGTDTPLYHKQHWNNRGQLYDMRLSTVNDDSNWNRGAIVNYYSLSNMCFGPSCTGTDTNGNLQIQQHFIPTDDAISNYTLMQQNYGYDSLNRINWIGEYMNGSGATPSGAQGYDYDRWGNRTINSGTWGTGINNKQFTVDAANNRLGVPSGQAGVMQYDANGNLLSDTYTSYGSRTYDAENRMVTAWDSSGQLSSYTYDFDGRRVRRKVGVQAEVWQVYGLDGELLAEYTANAAATSPQKEYGYRNGEMLVTASSGANVQWMVTDQLGTPRMIADRTGSLAGVKRHDYLPFGEELFAGSGNRTVAQGYSVADGVRQKFTSKERDTETGLDYFGARYYASVQGRFTGVDPMLVDQNRIFDPQRINSYAYARNNPLKFIDPDGADPKVPKVVINRTDTTYKVQGKTANDARKDAASQGASRHASGLPGETTWKYTFSAGFAYSAPQRVKGGGFTSEAKTTDVTVTVTITVDTPKWDGYATASPAEQQKWDNYINALKDHEEGHVEIAIKGATEVGNAVQSATATGTGRTPQQAVNNAKSNVSNAQDQNSAKADAKVRQQSDEYDDKTKHGKIPRKEVQ